MYYRYKDYKSKGGFLALTKKDLEQIGKIVGKEISGLETKTIKGFGILRLEMNQRFDATDKKIDGVESRLSTKIDEIKQMETEDVRALSDDIVLIKNKIGMKVRN